MQKLKLSVKGTLCRGLLIVLKVLGCVIFRVWNRSSQPSIICLIFLLQQICWPPRAHAPQWPPWQCNITTFEAHTKRRQYTRTEILTLWPQLCCVCVFIPLPIRVPGTLIGVSFFKFELKPTWKDRADPTQHEFQPKILLALEELMVRMNLEDSIFWSNPNCKIYSEVFIPYSNFCDINAIVMILNILIYEIIIWTAFNHSC